jgi:hypothetical protein
MQRFRWLDSRRQPTRIQPANERVVVDLDADGQTGRQAIRMHVGNRRVHAKRIQISDARDNCAALNRRAFLLA